MHPIHQPLLPLTLLALLACGPTNPSDSAPAANATVDLTNPPPSSRALLTQILTVTADVPVTATLVLDDGTTQRTVRPPHSGTDFTTGIPGFRADRPTDVTVTLTSADDTTVATESFTVAAQPLPSPFPELTVHTDDGDPARGDTIFPVRTEEGAGFLLMVDARGELIWGLDGGGTWWRTVRLLDDGQLLLIADHQVVMTDWGDLEPASFAPAGDGYHHEAIPRPGGGFFAFDAGPTQVPDFPRTYESACDPGEPTTIWDSIVVEADASGTVLQSWSLAERLDTHRIGWNSLAPSPAGPDWGHANGMQYLPESDSFIISMRNQDLLLELSRATGEIEWILSNPWGWKPEYASKLLAPTEATPRFPFHQHAPSWLDGNLLVHDNGAENDMPCGPEDTQPLGTRAVEFAVDRTAGTFTEVWSWEGPLFSPIMGDADRVGDGHVLLTYGQTDRDESGTMHADKGWGDLTGRMVEVDRATGDVVWDFEIAEEQRGENVGGFKIPRSQRLTSWWLTASAP